MAVALLYDQRFLDHDPGPMHPESPDRLRAIWSDLSSRPVPGTETIAPREATREELSRVHDPDTLRDLLFMSTNQYPFYPGTGHESETGKGEGAGFTVNAPLPAGCGDADYAAVFTDALLPIADAYRPELVLVSAGFDAHRADPLAEMNLSEDGFAAL